MSRMEPPRGRGRWAAAVVAAAALAAALAPSAAIGEPSSGVATANEPSAAAIDRADEYWTAKRMRNAQPADVELADQGAASQDDSGDVPVPQAGPIPYTSFELTDTTSYPNRVHGKVFFTKPGRGNYVCSGTVVDGANDSTVVTAAHCLNDDGIWSTNFVFVPGYQNGNAPFGVWAASGLFAPQAWVQFENLRYDFGVAVIARNTQDQDIEAAVGARGIAFNQPAQQFYRSHGYPAASPFNGSKLWACESEFGFFDFPWPNDGPPTMAIGCNMTGGSSGGGWVINGHDVVSLNSYKYLSQTEVMFGPYFGTTAESVFDQAQGTAPGASTAAVTPPPAAQPDPIYVDRSCEKLAKKVKKAKKVRKAKKATKASKKKQRAAKRKLKACLAAKR